MKKALALNVEKLDREWTELIIAALDAGISAEEIRKFFREHGKSADPLRILSS